MNSNTTPTDKHIRGDDGAHSLMLEKRLRDSPEKVVTAEQLKRIDKLVPLSKLEAAALGEGPWRRGMCKGPSEWRRARARGMAKVALRQRLLTGLKKHAQQVEGVPRANGRSRQWTAARHAALKAKRQQTPEALEQLGDFTAEPAS